MSVATLQEHGVKAPAKAVYALQLAQHDEDLLLEFEREP